jgi:hypothetical protein
VINRQCKRLKLINLQLPRLDKGVCFKDDKRLAVFILEAYKTSRSLADTTVFINTTVDSDRDYYPRISLLDRYFHPQPTFYVMKLAFLAI